MKIKNVLAIVLLLTIVILTPMENYAQNVQLSINEEIAKEVIEEINTELGTELRLVTVEEMGITSEQLEENRTKVWTNMTRKEYKDFLINSINELNQYLEENETKIIPLEEEDEVIHYESNLSSTRVEVAGAAVDRYAAYIASGYGIKQTLVHLPVWDLLTSFKSEPDVTSSIQFKMSNYRRSSPYGKRDLDITAEGSFYTIDGTWIRNGSTTNSFRANER